MRRLLRAQRARNRRPRKRIDSPGPWTTGVLPSDATRAAIRELEARMTRTETITVDELMRRRAMREHPVVTAETRCPHGFRLWDPCPECEATL